MYQIHLLVNVRTPGREDITHVAEGASIFPPAGSPVPIPSPPERHSGAGGMSQCSGVTTGTWITHSFEISEGAFFAPPSQHLFSSRATRLVGRVGPYLGGRGVSELHSLFPLGSCSHQQSHGRPLSLICAAVPSEPAVSVRRGTTLSGPAQRDRICCIGLIPRETLF